CENCNTPLPANSTEAMICTFECTFCRRCVEDVLCNVCPNCGGGFSPRPIRPSLNFKNDYFLGTYPASERVKHRPVETQKHDEFCKGIKNIPLEKR
ncbi:MAG: DUF1272 domain-containing protein, partial [Thermodesulfobacteriota bacterium]